MPYKRQRLINVDRLRVANSLEFVGKYVFPSIDGTSTYVLATDGSGQLYWSEGGNANLNPWVVKTTNYTATEGDRIIADTSGGTFTVSLPATPTAGWYVVIGGVTMTLSAFSGNHPNGTDWNFIFDNPSGPLPSTVTLTSNTGYTNIWKRLSWSGDTW